MAALPAGFAMSATSTATARQAANSSVATKPQLRVLLVEDDPADRDLILRELGKGEFEIIGDVVRDRRRVPPKDTRPIVPT